MPPFLISCYRHRADGAALPQIGRLLKTVGAPTRGANIMSSTEQHDPDSVTFRWLGVAGVEIACGNRSLLIDPYFSRLQLLQLLAGRPQPDAARITDALRRLSAIPAAIAITHTHLDHALDVPLLARQFAAPLFGSTGLDALLTRAGLPDRTTICRPGDLHEIPSFGRLRVWAGSHGQFLLGRPPFPGQINRRGKYPLPARGYRVGDVLVFDIEFNGRRFVHVGSAGVPTGALPAGACDVLFLCVPGWQADENYPAVFLRQLRPRLIVPIHIDRMTCPINDPRATHLNPLAARWLDLPGFLKRLEKLAPGIPVRQPSLWTTCAVQPESVSPTTPQFP